MYKFGLYSYCGYVNNTAGICTNTTIANKYQPYDALLADMTANYSALTVYIINGTSSFESQSMASHTRSAYYLILVGTICAFLALVMCAVSRFCSCRFFAHSFSSSGVFKRTLAFLTSACLAIIATTLVLTGASLWTSAVNSSESVNGLILNTTNIPLGIEVSAGPGLSLLWAAVGCLCASLIPYLIRYDHWLCFISMKRLSLPFLQLLHLPGVNNIKERSSGALTVLFHIRPDFGLR